AQVEGSDTAAGVVRESRGTRNNLRQGVDYLLDVDGARQLELFVLNDSQRARRGQVTPLNARPGNDNHVAFSSGLRISGSGNGRFGLVILLRICRRSDQGRRHDRSSQKRSFVETVTHSIPPLMSTYSRALCYWS